ncbi:DUF4097 family beta strand repeat-containing protein [Plantactinospora mayteni]|uniref:Lipoprotein n=1 Tax=Plantactinospora mayteni TaxID=566021 RepID=A0ABQ4F384_9ACTN|nr:DUF4097 family beta strand repeat-containing protein [Plantactinospora mayteni]GIH01373.1 lipoprotein [Plantactinospora mayteni]
MTTAHHRTRNLLSVVGALLALAALAGCGRSTDDAEPDRHAFALTGDRLTISKNNGDLDVRPADIDQVEVTRWFSGRSGIGGTPKATWNLAGEELILTTRCGAIGGACDVRYQVRVPKDVALTIDGDNGKISASGFDTALRIRSDNGAVSVGDVSGDLTLHTDGGQLRATGITSGRVDAGSQNGEIHLSFTAVPDQVEVRTENGAVTVDVPHATYKVTTTTESGDVRVDVPKDADSSHALTARTDNGPITLRTTDR